MKNYGLSNQEAKELLKKHGYNVIKDQSKRSFWLILRQQIRGNFMIYFMVLASTLSFFVGKTTTAYAILGVILVIIIVGFFQEYKAERAISALKNMLESFSTVIRDGKEIQINSKEIVPGDIILLEMGEKIPADCVILQAKDLMLNESILTGESKEVEKIPVKERQKDDYQQEQLVFMGTFIINGRGIGKVLQTGMNTEFGKIAGMISSAEKELPLKHKINRLVRFMASIAIVVSTLTAGIMLFNLEVWSKENIIEILIISVALMISAFPEGLPVVLISTLAGGAYKMSKKNAIVNRMSIIETLGETTVICSDKTGTITKGEMTVKELFTYEKNLEVSGIGYDMQGTFSIAGKKTEVKNNGVVLNLLKATVLCNNAHIINDEKGQKFKGTPTEIALMILGHKSNVIENIVDFERIEEIPFNSNRKMMSVIVQNKNKEEILYSKGAPEFFLEKCSHIQIGDKIVQLDGEYLSQIYEKISKLTNKKYRVLCVGYKKIEKNKNGNLEENMVLLGGVGLHDSPREGVYEAILSCYDAGIKVKMITGDNKETAVAIANDVGITGDVITGDELDNISDEELKTKIGNISIFARVKPQHKIRIVKVLKELGEIVTMTGDGVNDAPALKEAHIGVAMGINGTDVSREASDLILQDDNFVTIVSAIEEGRIIFKNIQKFVIYQLSCNIAELAMIFFAVLIGLPPPLIAIQILFMNLVTDNLPALTLGFTSGSGFVMTLKARRNSKILNLKKKLLILGVGLRMAFVCLIVYYISLKILGLPLIVSQSFALLTLIMFEISNAFNFRSLYTSFFKTAFSRNKFLIYASLISLLATVAIIYIKPLQKVFETKELPRHFRLISFGVSISIILVVDLIKKLNKKYFKNFGT